MEDFVLHRVESGLQREQATAHIREYLEWLNDRIRHDYDIEFDVEAMIRSDLLHHSKFSPPNGRFYLVQIGDHPVGVGCLKKIEEGVGEVQRMYVRPVFRGKGIGRTIANRLIDDARSIGYRRLKLESVDFLDVAHSMYQSMGFKEIDPYAKNSMKWYQAAKQLDRYYSIAVFMEMEL